MELFCTAGRGTEDFVIEELNMKLKANQVTGVANCRLTRTKDVGCKLSIKTQLLRYFTALFTKPLVSRLTAVLNQNMRLRMRVHAKRTELADAKSQCRCQCSRTRSLVREKAAVQNDLLGSFCMAVLHHSLFLLDGFRM